MKKNHSPQDLDSRRIGLVKTSILSIKITSARKDKVLEYVVESLEKPHESYYIVTPNPEMIVYASYHPEFKRILNNAEIALCDGIGLWIASKLLGHPIRQRITGVDFMESLCFMASEKPITVGFLGGRNEVAKITSERLQEKCPGLKVGFVGEEPQEIFNEKKKKHSDLQPVSPNSVDILFVAFGFPKQEEWMLNNLGKVNAKVMVGVGGAFDYISGKVFRAPRFIRFLGLEWLFRLLVQPWRWKRQIALIEFMGMVIKEIVGIR